MDTKRYFTQGMQNLHFKVDVLDINDNKIDELSDLILSGNITITNNDIVRRTLNMEFVYKNKTKIDKDSLLWINKRLQPWIGIENYKKEIYWVNMGIYVISNPQKRVSSNGKTVSIQGYDKMYGYHNHFMYSTKILANTPIHEVIRNIGVLKGETKFRIKDTSRTIPYDREFTSDTELMDELQQVTELYMDYQTYYDIDGYLVYEEIDNHKTDAPIWTFDNSNKDTVISKTTSYDYDSIVNHVKTLGEMDNDTTYQPMYEMKIEGADEQFSIENIGLRSKTYPMDNYTTEEQCRLKCEYEIEKSKRLSHTFRIETSPIYLINDVNKNIKIIDEGEEYICSIDEVTIPFGVGSMSITAHIVER